MPFKEYDPLITVYRDGNTDSPYKEITESFIVDSSGKVTLSEIPNKFHRVTVVGEDIDWIEVDKNTTPPMNGFSVNYKNRMVTFHQSNIGKQLEFHYFGEGLTFISVNQIYTENDGQTVTQTLGDLIESGSEAINALVQLDGKITEIDTKLDEINAIGTTVSTNETTRVNSENQRELNESTRQSNEVNRANAESTRASNELTRIDDESIRNTNEDNRNTSEQTRVDNEIIRQQNETNRNTTFNNKITEVADKLVEVDNILDNLQSVDFDFSTTYNFPTLVSYNGSTYIVLQEITGITPTNDKVNYRLIAQRGVDGTGSVSSVNGIFPDLDGNVVIPTSDVNVVDSLSSTSTVNALSANQGKVLNEKVTLAEQNAKVYTDQQIQTVTATGIPKLVRYEYTIYPTIEGQTTFEIPLETFDVIGDSEVIIQNQTILDPNEDYSIIGRTVTLTNSVTLNNTRWTLFIYKNVPIGTEGSINATVLADNTISFSKFDTSTQTLINGKASQSNLDTVSDNLTLLESKVGDKTTLQTTDKTSIVNAINEVFQTGNNVKSNTVDALLQVDSSLPITTSSNWNEIITEISNIETGVDTTDATATANDILSGKTAYINGSKLTGSMVNQGAKTIIPSTTNQTIQQGYHDGNGYVAGSGNLVASNIKNGVSIFGVTGSLNPSQYYQTTATWNFTTSNITISGINFTPNCILIKTSSDITFTSNGSTKSISSGFTVGNIKNNGMFTGLSWGGYMEFAVVCGDNITRNGTTIDYYSSFSIAPSYGSLQTTSVTVIVYCMYV